MDCVEKARLFAVRAHGDQRYDDLPYAHHLQAVAAVLADFGQADGLIAAGWLHDVIEDTPVSREDVEAEFGLAVGSLVWACTGEGATRAECNAAIYRKLAACPEAARVKLADRIANVEAAPAGSDHRARYQRENDGFRAAVEPLVPAEMWARLERAIRD